MSAVMKTDLFRDVLDALVQGEILTEQQASDLRRPETAAGIVPVLANAGVEPPQLAKAISKACNRPLYSEELGGETVSVDGTTGIFKEGILYLPNPFDGVVLSSAFDEIQKRGFELQEVGVVSAGAVAHEEEVDDPRARQEAWEQFKKVMAEALRVGASDVHIKPEAGVGHVRYRIDGHLSTSDHHIPNLEKYRLFANAILNYAGGDPGVYNKPESLRFSWKTQARPIQVRLEMNPVRAGEDRALPRFVLRILNQNTSLGDIAALGLSHEHATEIKGLARRKHGVMLVTGPTGSGKTTTLYAALKYAHSKRPYESFNTIEDPVEIEYAPFNQIEVNEGAGVTFESALRSLLRSDPDKILVGEIRDAETASLAVRAALTGHLVFSTLHTNSAIEALPRLLDLGLKPQLLSDALLAVTAQRMVAKLCPECAESQPLAQHPDADRYQRVAHDMRAKVPNVPVAKGCPSCDNTGYRGRTIINEVFVIDDVVKTMIVEDKSTIEITKYARGKGFKPLWADALRLLNEGITTIEALEDTLGPPPAFGKTFDYETENDRV